MVGAGDAGELGYVASRLIGRVRLLTGMVRANRPGRALLGLSKLLVGAFGTAAIALVREVVQYHWHPSERSHEANPHLHIGSAQIADDAVMSQSQHLPTGRITVEAVIRMAVKEFHVEPLKQDWDDVPNRRISASPAL